MEDWEKDYIRRCKPLLLCEIKCTTVLLAALFSKAVLSEHDIEAIEARVTDGNTTQVNKLLDVLQTRTGAYKTLVKALQTTGQSGAALILCPKPPFTDEYPEIFHGVVGKLLKSKIQKKILTSKAIGNVINLDLNFIPNSMHDSLSCYIPRKIISRNRINPELFAANSQDIFIFTGIDWSELSDLAKPNETDITCKQTSEITVRFMILEFDEDFDEICEISAGQPVHLIAKKSDGFELVRSHGNIETIQNFIIENQSMLTEQEFIQEIISTKSPVCLADTPGMGKTALFASIAKQVEQSVEKRVVIFISLKDLSNKIPEHFDFSDCEKLYKILASCATNENIKADILVHIFSYKIYPVHLFLDGFDEVPQNRKAISNKLLNYLTHDKQMKNIQVLATTRPHVAPDLETSLGVLAYSIQPFQLSDQTNFLVQFWVQECGALRNSRLLQIAECCVRQLKSNIFSDLERDIAGLPLQCKLLAQVYARDATKFSKGHSSHVPIDISSVFDMYNLFFQCCFDKAESERIRSKVVLMHQSASLNLLFPQWSHVYQHLESGNQISLRDCNIYEFGIFETRHSITGPTFVHRSFAEYLVASWLVDKLVALNEKEQINAADVVNLFMNSILGTIECIEPVLRCGIPQNSYFHFSKFSEPVIAYFLDSFLKQKQLSLSNTPHVYLSLFTKPLQASKFFSPKYFYDRICSCIYHDFNNLFILLCILYLDNSSDIIIDIDCMSWPSVLLFASKYSSRRLLKSCYKLYEKIHNNNFETNCLKNHETIKVSKLTITPLHLAAQVGCFKKVEYFLRKNTHGERMQSILHLCVIDSAKDSVHVISQKKDIIKLLAKKNPSLLNERTNIDSETGTPLHMPNVHLELIKYLVQIGADIYSVNSTGNFVTHLAASYMNSEDYHSLVKYLIEANYPETLTNVNYNGSTSVQLAVRNFEVKRETLELLRPLVDFNLCDEEGNNLLFTAVRGQRSRKLLEYLIGFGCSYMGTEYMTRPPIHMAVYYENVEAVWFLASLAGVDVNQPDKNGDSPLHIAVKWTKRNFELVEALVKNGGKVDALDGQGHRPIWLVSNFPTKHSIDVRTIKLLESSLKFKKYQ